MFQPTQGTRLERYVVDRPLGEGGVGIVYRVVHSELGTWHALKLVHRGSESTWERLVREGRAQARLRHPNVVPVTDVIRIGGVPAIVMEYVPGPSLADLIARGPLSMEQVDALGKGLIKGIWAIHSAGIVHRDIKPANVLLYPVRGGVVPKVTDFGLAKDASGTAPKTRTGAVLGTPLYMSPEQVRDAKSVDMRSDLFSLGAVLFEMVTGTRAFDADCLADIYRAIEDVRYPPLEEFRADVPDRISSCIRACLKKSPEDRPADCAEVFELFTGRPIKDTERPMPLHRPEESIGNTPSAPITGSLAEHTVSIDVSFHSDDLPDSNFATWIGSLDGPTALSQQPSIDSPPRSKSAYAFGALVFVLAVFFGSSFLWNLPQTAQFTSEADEQPQSPSFELSPVKWCTKVIESFVGLLLLLLFRGRSS